MIRLVCFDLGGVLIRITQLWHEAAGYAGVKIRPDFDPTKLLPDAPSFDPYQTGEIDDEAYFEALAQYLGAESPTDALAVHNHILIEPYPGVEKLLSDLASAGLATACLSNTNAPHWVEMIESGRFPPVESLWLRMASHEVRLQKPDPAIFRFFEQASGFTGDQIAFFDDTNANVLVAQELGWHAYRIDPKGDTSAQMREHLNNLGVLVPAGK